MHVEGTAGGFYAAIREDGGAEDLSGRLAGMKADVHTFPEDGVILAAVPAFAGQGLWVGPDGGLSYDLDLSNEAELRTLAGLDANGRNPGQLLWLLYRKFGTDFIDRLRGAFAFALWDRTERKMIVATDAFGIRPVVYSKTEHAFVAASRIGFVLADPGHDTQIDPEAIYHYLFFHAICSPVTIYKSIQKLEPGNGLIFHNGQIKRFTYYDIVYQPIEGMGEPYWRKRILEEVEKAVSVYVPRPDPGHTGCFLSGGTDSSSVAGFYTRLGGTPAKTFSIGFDEPAYNELEYARIAVNHFGTEQHEYCVTPKDVLDLMELLPRVYDEPFGNSSVVPAYYCAKLARENGVNILLGGDGGDEIFGGNERYVHNLVFSLYDRFPAKLRKRLFEPLLSLMPDLPAVYKARRYVRRANFPNPDRFFSYHLLSEMGVQKTFRQDYIESLDPDCFLDLARNLYRNAAPAHDTDRLLYIDMKFTITDNDLRKVSQMAEAVGVRVRYPLLDRDLVDFTATIPPNLKVKWGKGRYIFKQAMRGFLPKEIIHKTKQGMGLPIAIWFKNDRKLYELLHETLFIGTPQITQWIRPELLNRLRREFEKDETTYYGGNLWVFLLMELWFKKKRSLIC